MKKLFKYILFIVLIVAATGAWFVFGPATAFEQKTTFLFIRQGIAAKTQVNEQLKKENILRFPAIFNIVAEQTDVWKKLQPGRFEIKKGESIFNIVRTLRNNTQTPVRLVINKLRTKEDLARLIGRNFAVDSTTAMLFLLSNDSLSQFNADTNTVMSFVIPDTYLLKWNTTISSILGRLKAESEKFWSKSNRLQRAQNNGLTPLQVYILASIVEEESNRNEEKGNIASVYINRMNKGIPLGADPTIKYALRDFSIKRIYYGYLTIESPYNTYKYKGLPPGPVCTPSQVSIDAVLNAPKTDYLFFVAKSDFSGYHHFSNNFAEHQHYAKEYQKALDSLIAKKQSLDKI